MLGVVMGFKSGLKRIRGHLFTAMSLGANKRLEHAQEQYRGQYRTLQDALLRVDAKKAAVAAVVNGLIEEKVAALTSLKKIEVLSAAIRMRDRTFPVPEIDLPKLQEDLAEITASISAGEAALDATRGVTSGVATATGAWALVGYFGTASTGTAIGTLSGAAATSATLAWFGGGSLAAGGGGMILGQAVLGGIVAIPTIAITGVVLHLRASKYIKRLREEEVKVATNLDACRNIDLRLDIVERRAREITAALQEGIMAFDALFEAKYREIMTLVAVVVDGAASLAKVMDSTLLERDGSVNETASPGTSEGAAAKEG